MWCSKAIMIAGFTNERLQQQLEQQLEKLLGELTAAGWEHGDRDGNL